MAWSFGDGYDLYVAFADAYAGYWDSGAGTPTFIAGRFAGSQALHVTATSTTLTKSSAVNDAVHHLVVAFRQTAAIGGTTLGLYLQLLDGVTNQCCVVFRSDGAILLTSGGPAGTVLATYAGAFPATNTWYAFEFEIVVNNTTGSFTVRKNGNTSNDFTLGSLNTRTSANNYANKLTIGMQAVVSAHDIDDLFWRSDTASVAWMGDIRCFTRMPASDASVQFSRTTPVGQIVLPGAAGQPVPANTAKYIPFTPTMSGNISNITFTQHTGVPTTANMKCAIYATNPGTPPLPAAILAQATAPINCSTIGAGGAIVFTFSPALAVSAGTTYAAGVDFDAVSGNLAGPSPANSMTSNTQTYATFPVNNPTGLGASNSPFQLIITLSPVGNYMVVNEPQQDAATSYVYDSTPGDADFYGIGTIASTPATTIAVTTRGYMQKSDAGVRTAAVQLKSGATTVASPTLALSSSGWSWAWRTDVNDPATGAAWTAAAVNNLQCGPVTVT